MENTNTRPSSTEPSLGQSQHVAYRSAHRTVHSVHPTEAQHEWLCLRYAARPGSCGIGTSACLGHALDRLGGGAKESSRLCNGTGTETLGINLDVW
ncbi:hypothetical protein J3F83DRAFT_589380 [Trichoderma novae-zelandiae]